MTDQTPEYGDRPKRVDPESPPECPRPPDCKCTWTLQDFGWMKGTTHAKCPHNH